MTFLALRSLNIYRVTNFTSLYHLLRSIKSKKLRTLNISIGHNPQDYSFAQRAVEALSGLSSLRSLMVSTLGDAIRPVTFGLGLLANLRHLQHLSLCGLYLNSPSFLRLIREWPDLESLTLRGSKIIDNAGRLYLVPGYLRILAIHLPKLKELTIAINTSGGLPPSNQKIYSPNRIRIDLSESPLDEDKLEAFAKYIAEVFPNGYLREDFPPLTIGYPYCDEYVRLQERWKTVARLVPDISRASKERMAHTPF